MTPSKSWLRFISCTDPRPFFSWSAPRLKLRPNEAAVAVAGGAEEAPRAVVRLEEPFRLQKTLISAQPDGRAQVARQLFRGTYHEGLPVDKI